MFADQEEDSTLVDGEGGRGELRRGALREEEGEERRDRAGKRRHKCGWPLATSPRGDPST